MAARPDQDGLPRPVVTLDGAPPPAPPPDLLLSGDDGAHGGSLLRRTASLLSWQPARDLTRPLLAAAAATLVAGSAGAVALQLRDPSLDPDDVLAATIEAGRYRVELTSEIVEPGAEPQPEGFDGVGAATFDVDLDRNASRFTLAPADGHVRLEVIVIGDDTWTRFGHPGRDGDAYALTDDDSWMRSSTEASRVDGLGTDGGLRTLLEAGEVVERLADTEVDGVGVAEVLVDLTPRTTGDDEDALGAEDEEVRARMAVDAEGRLRRLVVEQAEEEIGRTRSTLTVSRFGDDPGIDPPPDEQVSDGRRLGA